MSTCEEKRRHPRGGVRWPADIRAKGGVIPGEMKNISVSGAYVHCASLPKAGEIVSVTIRPPGHKSIEIVAEVIWTAAEAPIGLGMAFMDISDEDRWFISEAVTRSRPV